MNRRLFLASLFAPFVARFAPKPAFLESRAFDIEQIARVFAVPPEMLGGEYITLSGALDQLCGASFTWSVTPDKMMRFEPPRRWAARAVFARDGLPSGPERERPTGHGKLEHEHFTAWQFRRLPHLNS